MCEIHKEQFNDEWSTNTDADNNPLDNESDPAEVSTTDASAVAIRNVLKDYVLSHPL